MKGNNIDLGLIQKPWPCFSSKTASYQAHISQFPWIRCFFTIAYFYEKFNWMTFLPTWAWPEQNKTDLGHWDTVWHRLLLQPKETLYFDTIFKWDIQRTWLMEGFGLTWNRNWEMMRIVANIWNIVRESWQQVGVWGGEMLFYTSQWQCNTVLLPVSCSCIQRRCVLVFFLPDRFYFKTF